MFEATYSKLDCIEAKTLAGLTLRSSGQMPPSRLYRSQPPRAAKQSFTGVAKSRWTSGKFVRLMRIASLLTHFCQPS
jgi:hypothetical protein